MMRAILLVTVALVAQEGTKTVLPLIERNRIGPVVVGADAQKIYEAFPGREKLVDLGYEGILSPALLLRFVGTSHRDGVVAELIPVEGRLTVWRIEIRDPAFRTNSGLGVGSTVGQLRAAYTLGSVLSGEGKVVVRVDELSASFVLDQTGPGGAQLRQVRTPELVPDTVKITSVLLTR